MVNIIILSLLILNVFLVKIFRSLSTEAPEELKRRARSGDMAAARLFRIRSNYGAELHALIIILLLISLGFISGLSGRYYQLLSAVLITVLANAAVLLLSFLGSGSINLASNSSVIFEPILKLAHPVLRYLGVFLEKYFHLGPNKKISSKDEMLGLMEDLAKGSVLTAQERKAVSGALTYGDKKIRDYLIPNSIVKDIKVSEELSPVVIGELHDSGHSRFPVYSDDGKNVLGTLFMKDAVTVRKNKKTAEVMHPEAYYLNEEQTLAEALKAFLKTKHHLFMVVNAYEDIVGIITIEDVLEQIIGEKIVDEFDQYDDLKVVAARLAEKKREERA